MIDLLLTNYLKLVPEATGCEEHEDGTLTFYDDEGDVLEGPTQAIIDAETLRGAEYSQSRQYAVKRVKEYPSIGNQLDALFKAGAFTQEMTEQIQAIKDKYPKS